MSELHEFKGMSGVAGTLRGPVVRTRTAFMALIGARINGHHYRVIAAAGDHGAVQVWIDDAGKYRGAFMQRFSIVDGQEFKTKKQINAWLKEWLPRMAAH